MSFHRSLSLHDLVGGANSLAPDEFPDTLDPGRTTRNADLYLGKSGIHRLFRNNCNLNSPRPRWANFSMWGKLRRAPQRENVQTHDDFNAVIKELFTTQQDQNATVSTSVRQLNESLPNQKEGDFLRPTACLN